MFVLGGSQWLLDPDVRIDEKERSMTIQPKGEELRKAIKWIDAQLQYEGQTDFAKAIAEASIKFDLSPMDAEYLTRFYKQPG